MRRGVAIAALLAAGVVQGAPLWAAQVTIAMGTEVHLETAQPLSSKTNVKGDLVTLTVTAPVQIDDRVVIPAGTPAVGQISDAQAKGAMGMSGRLVINPLYLQVNGRTIRLTGAKHEQASLTPGAVIGLAVLSAGFTGRSATIPAGTPLLAMTERTVALNIEDNAKPEPRPEH